MQGRCHADLAAVGRERANGLRYQQRGLLPSTTSNSL